MARIRKANKNSNMMITRSQAGGEEEAMLFEGTWAIFGDGPDYAICDFGDISDAMATAVKAGKVIEFYIPANSTVEELKGPTGEFYCYTSCVQLMEGQPTYPMLDPDVSPITTVYSSDFETGEEDPYIGHLIFYVNLK